MSENQSVSQFTSAIRKKLNLHRVWTIMLWSALAAGISMLAVALVYVIPGYSVPLNAYLVISGIVFLVALSQVLIGRKSNDTAAQYADDFFALKDAVSSCTHFAQAKREGEFYRLQSKLTQELVKKSSVSDIQYAFPFKVALLAAISLIVAATLGLKGPSDKVLQRLETQQSTLLKTKSANDALKQLIDELDQATEDEEERKLLEPDKLRKWVEQLQETKDLKEAMRQYARLEMKLNKSALALKQRNDEKLLDQAAEELKTAEDLKSLAEKLKQKKYKKAAAELKELRPEKLTEADLKKLSQKRKQLAMLKAAANRMASAARATARQGKNNRSKQQSGRNGRKSSSKSNGQNSDSPSAENEDDTDGPQSEDSELAEMLEELDEAVEEWDDELEELEFEDFEEMDGDFEECEDCQDCIQCEDAARAKLDRLGKKLMRMARRRAAMAKLKKLSDRASRCQSECNGAALVQTNRPGGREAGKGISATPREERDKLIDNRQNTALKGIKGDGPSLTKVEAADEGSGVSHRKGVSKQRNFEKQFESFIEREDIPEDLKSGVKRYFTNIHENE